MTDVAARVLYFGFGALFFGFVGFYIGSKKGMDQVSKYEMRIATDSLKFELERQNYEHKAKELKLEMATRQTQIDKATPAELDSIWGAYGFN